MAMTIMVKVWAKLFSGRMLTSYQVLIGKTFKLLLYFSFGIAGWWDNELSLSINGTDGSLIAPYISKDDVLQVFVPDMCR